MYIHTYDIYIYRYVYIYIYVCICLWKRNSCFTTFILDFLCWLVFCSNCMWCWWLFPPTVVVLGASIFCPQRFRWLPMGCRIAVGDTTWAVFLYQVHVFIFIHIYICTCTKYIYTHIYIYIHTKLYMYMYVIYLCIYIYIYYIPCTSASIRPKHVSLPPVALLAPLPALAPRRCSTARTDPRAPRGPRGPALQHQDLRPHLATVDLNQKNLCCFCLLFLVANQIKREKKNSFKNVKI